MASYFAAAMWSMADAVIIALDTKGTATTPRRLRVAAAAVAGFVGVDVDDIVFVVIITTGANAVLRSFPFDPGDEIAVTNLGYGGVINAAKYVTRTIGGTLRTIELLGDTVIKLAG